MPIIKRFTKRLLEAEVDGQELNPEQPTDYTEDPGGTSSGEQPADDNAQTQPEEAPPQEGEVAQGEETTDYTDENQFPMDDGGGDNLLMSLSRMKRNFILILLQSSSILNIKNLKTIFLQCMMQLLE